ncbi:hypothetical protein F5Y05DRAFT_416100 [Hypoxylon sp. FL0543]|nr:hypothetical protein F5Y05DRAFT_416100 [Hypoxylon sp. FL0543]
MAITYLSPRWFEQRIEKVYTAAADTGFRVPEHPWRSFNTEKADKDYMSPESTIFSLIPRSHHFWAGLTNGHVKRSNTYFHGLSVDEKLRVLESIPSFIPHDEVPIGRRMRIITGIDALYSQKTHAQISRRLRVVKNMFVTSGKGKILLFCRTAFDVAHVLNGESSFVDINEEDPKDNIAAHMRALKSKRILEDQ